MPTRIMHDHESATVELLSGGWPGVIERIFLKNTSTLKSLLDIVRTALDQQDNVIHEIRLGQKNQIQRRTSATHKFAYAGLCNRGLRIKKTQN